MYSCIICLVLSEFSIGRKSIWGGLVVGVIIALIAGVINLLIGNGLNWNLVKNITVVCILAGASFNLLDLFAARGKKMTHRS